MELTIDRLTKQYKNKIAVDRLSFSLTKGVTGLLGANGAGKTTLIRMLCGILVPTSGEITYNGISVSDEHYRNVLSGIYRERFSDVFRCAERIYKESGRGKSK